MNRYTLLMLLYFVLLSCNNAPNKSTTTATNNSKNKALIEQYFKHFNDHNWEKMVETYIDSPMLKDPAYGINSIVMSKPDIFKKYKELHQAIPDIQDSIIAVYYAADNAIVEFESSGTGPDGKKFTLPICTIFEIKNGKITKDLTYYDNFEAPEKK